MEYTTLSNGVEMPVLGFGVYQITNEQECEQAVVDALAAGYRLIDTASVYGNERAVGRAIERSGLDRSEVFITTKLWVSDMNYRGARASFDESCNRLGTDYIDLYLLHHPMNDVYGAWQAMEELYNQGRIHAVGVCNFFPARLDDLMIFNGISPQVNQIECNPFYQRENERQWFALHNVQTEAWAPFAEGRNGLFQNEALAQIGKAHGKTVAQVIIRWLLQRKVVSLAKTARKERMAENIDVFDFVLSPQEMAAISALDKDESSFFDQRNPDTIERLATLASRRA